MYLCVFLRKRKITEINLIPQNSEYLTVQIVYMNKKILIMPLYNLHLGRANFCLLICELKSTSGKKAPKFTVGHIHKIEFSPLTQI